jgi:hypothetical protein
MLHSLSPLLLLAVSLGGVSATPIEVREAIATANLPIARRFDFAGYPNIADADRARASELKKRGFNARRENGNIPVTNAVVTYTANVGIGSPATQYTLLVDTGSSNTWVGANKKYHETSTSRCPLIPQPVSVTYGSGSFKGYECTDEVTLGKGLVIKKQSIGVATTSSGFSGVDGILGVGPIDLTQGTVTGLGDNEIPTVVNNLFSQGTITEPTLGVFFAPTTSESETNGELAFGTPDKGKCVGPINYTPITTTSPASEYWGINEEITYGGTVILETTAGIVDTGTTLVLIATNAFQVYQSQTGATMDQTTGLLTITSEQYTNLKNLNFVVGGETYALTPNAQIWPRSLNSVIGGNAGQIYLIVADLGSNSGQGLDFINGYTFLERYYSVFVSKDTTQTQVGFAPTEYTDATSN